MLAETQVRDLELGTLHATMWPLVLPSPTNVFEIYDELGMGQSCQAAICPIVEDDEAKTWKSRFALWNLIQASVNSSPKVSGTKKCRNPEPYKAVLWVEFSLNKPYPYSLYRWDSSILGT